MALAGELTLLRAVEPADAERAYRWVNDLEVTEHLSLRYPISRESERDWAERASSAQSYTNVLFAIETLEGELIGTCNFHGLTPEDRVGELGVLIGEKSFWDRGYGFDALRTLITFGFRELNLRRVWLRVDDNHPRGIRLYEKLGLQHAGRLPAAHWTRGKPVDFLIMGMQRDEFDARYGAFEEVGDVPRG
jgi:RimJ/RimL family protein N-acetyltransferase